MNLTLTSSSSFNIRKGRTNDYIKTESCHDFKCSLCKKQKHLGVNDGAYIKVSYDMEGQSYTVELCSRCSDLLIDSFIWGQKPSALLESWQIRSRMCKVSLVQKDMYCPSCATKCDSHLGVQFDHLSVAGRAQQIIYRRMCARCVVTYIEILRNRKGLYACTHEYFKADPNSLSNGWVASRSYTASRS